MKRFANTSLKGLLIRVLAGICVLIMIGSLLCACGGKTTVEDVTCDHTDDNRLSKNDLNTLATFIRDTKSDDKEFPYSLREVFTAAYRGIDMLADGFDDKKAEPVYKIVDEKVTDEYASNLDAAKKAIKTYDTKGKVAVEYDIMNETDMKSIIDGLQTQLDIESGRSFLGSILYYIGVALMWVTNTIGFGSYIIGLLVFAIAMELILIPFSIKQQKNSIKQGMLKPKEMAIKKKYAGRTDTATQQKMNQEIQEMYQRENFNPMGGCLPLLLQLPIVFALYYIVIDPLQYMLGQSTNLSTVLTSFYTTAKAAGGYGGAIGSNRGTIEILSYVRESGIDAFKGLKEFLFYTPETSNASFSALSDISGKIPNFNVGTLNFGLTPGFDNFPNITSLLLLVPVLTFLSYYFSMKVTKKMTPQPAMAQDAQMGCSNKIMELLGPLMSVWVSFMVPAAVGVYWIFKSLVGMGKSVIMNKAMPLPQFTEEDYKAAERELLGKAPKKRSGESSGSGSGTKGRSLHHIDDEDYDNTPVAQRKKPVEPYREDDEDEKPAEKPSNDEKKSGSDMISGAELKDYDDREKDKSEGENQDPGDKQD